MKLCEIYNDECWTGPLAENFLANVATGIAVGNTVYRTARYGAAKGTKIGVLTFLATGSGAAIPIATIVGFIGGGVLGFKMSAAAINRLRDLFVKKHKNQISDTEQEELVTLAKEADSALAGE